MLCVPRVGSLGHKWTPNTVPGTTPLVSYSSRGEAFCVRGACIWSTCCRSNATCSCRILFCCCNCAYITSNLSLLCTTLHICSSISVTLCECEHIQQMFFEGQNLAILVLLNFCLQPLQWFIFLSASMLGSCGLDL